MLEFQIIAHVGLSYENGMYLVISVFRNLLKIDRSRCNVWSFDSMAEISQTERWENGNDWKMVDKNESLGAYGLSVFLPSTDKRASRFCLQGSPSGAN